MSPLDISAEKSVCPAAKSKSVRYQPRWLPYLYSRRSSRKRSGQWNKDPHKVKECRGRKESSTKSSRKVMAEKKNEQSGFTVTDRRLFTSEGELRSETREDESPKPAATPAKDPGATPSSQATTPSLEDREMPPPPTSAEQEAQAAAYKQSSRDLDTQVEMSGHSAKDFEITFERFLASLYMTAMLQLGLM